MESVQVNPYRTRMVRVWGIVHKVYKEFCDDAKVTMSDFLSLLLYHVAFDEPLITYVLQNEFEMEFDEARDLAEKLAEKMEEVGKILWGDENA